MSSSAGADAPRGDGITRRTAVHGGGVALAGLIVATGTGCLGGDDDDGTATSSGSPAGKPKQGGDLVVGITAGTTKDTFNPFYSSGTIDQARLAQVFEGFAEYSPKGSSLLLAAESMEPNGAADEWTIRVRDGLEFHNGKTADAEDVRHTLEFALDPKNGALARPQLQDVDLAATKPLDKRTLRIKLKKPNAIFNYTIGTGLQNNVVLVPVGFDPAKPVGTGPFRLKSFTPGREATFERFENYWQEGEPYLDTVKVLDFADAAAKVNALIAGQVMAIDSVPEGQVPVLERNDSLKLLISQTGGLRALHMHCGKEPWTDVRARQALKLALDRDQLVEQALAGFGIVGYDVYGKYFDSAYPDDYTKPRDVEKAASLLKASGQGDVPVTLTQSDAASGLLAAAQLMPAQLEEAGFKVELDRVDNNTLYGDEFTKWQLMGDWWGAVPYLMRVQTTLLPGAPLNLTHWKDDEFFGLYDQALRTVDRAKQDAIIEDMMLMDSDRGGMAVWAFPKIVDAYSAKITGFVPSVKGHPLTSFRFKNVWFV